MPRVHTQDTSRSFVYKLRVMYCAQYDGEE